MRPSIVTSILLGIVAAAFPASDCRGAVVTFDTQAAFAAQLAPGSYFETFQSFSDGAGLATPTNFAGGSGNQWSLTATTTAQAFLMFTLPTNNRYLTTSGQFGTGWSAPVTLTFTGSPVHALGGSLFFTLANGNVTGGTVSLQLSDGTQTQLINQGNTSFWGVTSDAAITSLSITPDATHHFVSIDNLRVGTTPAPGTMAAAVGGVGLLALRRRRGGVEAAR